MGTAIKKMISSTGYIGTMTYHNPVNTAANRPHTTVAKWFAR